MLTRRFDYRQEELPGTSTQQGILVALIFLLLTSLARGDTVHLTAADGSRGTISVTGEIVDYTGQQLQLRRLHGQIQSYDANRVLKITTTWPSGYQPGIVPTTAGEIRAAIPQLLAATQAEGRPWARRMILIELMQCHANLGEWSTAGDLFVAILSSDPTSPALQVAPLAWYPVEGIPPSKIQNWLTQRDNPAAQLLGASHALQTSQRPTALTVLQQLRAASNQQTAFLAAAQMWRAELVTVTSTKVARWEQRLRQEDERLSAGPWFVLAQALARLNRIDEAQLAYLRLPILHPEQRQLAAQALLEGSKLATQQGRLDEARKIARELTRDYADTPPAREAESMLQSAHH